MKEEESVHTTVMLRAGGARAGGARAGGARAGGGFGGGRVRGGGDGHAVCSQRHVLSYSLVTGRQSIRR